MKLSTDLPQVAGDSATHTVILGPAIPKEWAGGKANGLRLRGGGFVGFSWSADGGVNQVTVRDRSLPINIVDKNGKVLRLA